MASSPRKVFVHKLRDGASIALGPVIPEDKERIRDGIARLSRTSRYLRFFSATTQLSEEQLDYLVNVDQVNHVAWGAMDPSEPHLPGVGLARFVRSKDQPDTAEMAVAVVDDFQGRGLGAVLLALLWLSAEPRGLRSLRALVLPENQVTCQWMASLGATLRRRDDHFEADLPIVTNSSELPETGSAQRLAALIQELREAHHRCEVGK